MRNVTLGLIKKIPKKKALVIERILNLATEVTLDSGQVPKDLNFGRRCGTIPSSRVSSGRHHSTSTLALFRQHLNPGHLYSVWPVAVGTE